MRTALLTALLLPAIAGCPKPAAPVGLKLDPPAWAEQEIDQYAVIVADDTVGTHLVQVRRTEFEGVPALNLVIETMVAAGGTDSHDSAWTMLRLDNLRPIRSVRSIANTDFKLSVDVSYSDDSARALAMTPNGPQRTGIPLEPLDYDNDQLTTLIRALPLTAAEPVAFNTVIGVGGTKVPAEVTLIGNETVTVAAGTFDCRHVRLAIAGQSIDIWYETAGLRRMVSYAAPVADLRMELAASIID